MNIDGWIEETISGTKNYDKRKLGELLNKVKKDNLIICGFSQRKIEAIGVPLKDWDISINYGIKTGFNAAFIYNFHQAENQEVLL